MSIGATKQAAESDGQDALYKSAQKETEVPVFILNPFDEYVLRFNYTEVADVKDYAEALAAELKTVPLSVTIK